MTNIATISELLQLSDSQYRIFDIGRRIEKLSKEQFEKIELNQIPYPTPSQGHAFIAIVFWQNKKGQSKNEQGKKVQSEPYLWLVKLPLDERGLLNQGARNHFVAIIVEALGSNLSADPTEQQEELLKNNPYIFTPAQYKLAALNSKIKVELKQTASDYLAPFETYLTGDLGWDNWQVVGVQGITDFAARLTENSQNQSTLLEKAIPHLPEEVLLPLCSALENESLNVNVIDSLLARLSLSLQKPDQSEQQITLQQHLLRSLGASAQHPHVNKYIQRLLQQQHLSADLLITLSGRCWQALQNNDQLMAFFEHLVVSEEPALFNNIFKDLVAIPTLRPIVFQCMRSPNRSKALAQAIGLLFNQAAK